MKSQKSIKKTLLTVLGISFIIFGRFLPLTSELSQDAIAVATTFVGSLILWIAVGIDWPSVLCIVSLSFIPALGGPKAVFASSFGSETFIFLLFTFICTYALSKTSYVRKIAISFVTSSIAKKGPWALATSFLASVLIIGCFMSPTVLFFIMLPILEEILSILDVKKGEKYGSMLMIGLVTCTSLSSGMTPIAHVFPVIAIKTLAEHSINFGAYMGVMIPAGILVFIAMMLIFKFMMKPNTDKFKALSKSDFSENIQSTKSEKITLLIFIAVVILWVSPSLIKGFMPGTATFIESYGIAIPPMLATIALCLIKIDDKPLLSLNEAMTKGVSWPSMIMTAAALAMSAALGSEAIGLTTFIASAMSSFTSNVNPTLFVFIFVLWAALQSNVSSHIVTSKLVSSVAVPVALASTVVNPAAIAYVIGFVASSGSSTPPSMPYVAVAGSSGWTDTKDLMNYGFRIALCLVVIATLFAYPLIAALL